MTFFRFIEDCRADYPVTVMCGVLGVSPPGYYAWRSPPESRRAVANRHLIGDIKRVHRDTHGRYGSPRIHVELKAQGREMSRGRIERLMRRHGIRAVNLVHSFGGRSEDQDRSRKQNLRYDYLKVQGQLTPALRQRIEAELAQPGPPPGWLTDLLDPE